MLRRFFLALPLAAALVLPACGDDSFHVQRAPEFPKASGAALSIFGVYRDGRLAPEAWDSFRSHLAPLFGTSPCEPGYPDILTTSGTPALQAVDDFSRANGVTDELLDHLAPAAKGDLVLLITMTGRPGKPTESDNLGPSAAAPSMRGGGRRGQGGVPTKKPVVDTNTFEAVGIVFSVKAHHSVAAIRLAYTGASLEDALQSFMTKLGAELPQATCAGWKGDLRIDASDIRRIETE